MSSTIDTQYSLDFGYTDGITVSSGTNILDSLSTDSFTLSSN